MMETRNPIRVLSIDFDFFQQLDNENVLDHYPDGHDLNTDLSIFVWTGHYVNPNDKDIIENIKNNNDQLNAVKDILHENSIDALYNFSLYIR